MRILTSARRSAVVSVLAFLLVVAGAQAAHACSCLIGDPRDALHRSDGAFVGTLVERSEVDAQVRELAERYRDARDVLFIGRHTGYPVALEGALKLKELSYIHAEGFPAAELKHGPIALVEEGVPVVAIATECHVYPKMLSNIQEVRARGADVIAIATEGDEQIGAIADHVLEVPSTPELLSPVVVAVPLQLFAYHVAKLRGCDVDQPRNLAKSVTVE